ncbi:MAG: recombinase family protein [Clostridia bacterium]|nr:recombinase family protein [Clostridia bacterium]
MAKIERIEPLKKLPKLRNVAAYARVSSPKDAMKHSPAAQVGYYSSMIQSHPGWNYAGVFIDEGITGTRETREGFQRLLEECRAGKIDMVITKSISRFARNTVTLLSTVRELKSLGIDVFFEEQQIHTMSCEGELMLTILASFAQEESLSASENQKWRIKKNFEEGKPWSGKIYGYRLENGVFIALPDEASIVRRVFKEYLSGCGTEAIANGLNSDGIPTRKGGKWYPAVIWQMLRNFNYTGSLLLKKTYREDHITKRKRANDGVLPQYLADDTHEAIIDMGTFEAVQEEIARRQELYKHRAKSRNSYPFSGLIVCASCGRKYKRKTAKSGHVWICPTFNSAGKAVCPSKQIPEETLKALTEGIDLSAVEHMIAEDGNIIQVCFRDGTKRELKWKDRSRAESWTEEMRQAAREAALKGGRKNGER